MPNPDIDNNPGPAIAVLGLGPMGQALAGAALDGGHRTVVWNRTADKAAGLVRRGAEPAATPAEAVRRAAMVVCCVLNYRAAAAVVDTVDDWSAATLVNLTSGHSGEARTMAAWAAGRSVPYLDGAILTPAPTIGSPAASILYSGPRALFERGAPVLRTFAGTTTFVGDDHGAAAGYETALLDLFAMAVGGVAHGFAMAAAENIAPPAFAPLARGIGALLPGLIDGFADQLSTGEFPATVSSIASAASATAHVVEAADAHGIDPAPLRALHALLSRAVAEGHGGAGYARLSRLLVDDRHPSDAHRLPSGAPHSSGHDL